jgi:dihydrofolate reductase
MGNVIFGMMVSLDGYVADRTGSVRRLYPEGSLGANTLLEEAIATTGAVVMGRRIYQMGEPDSYADSYEFQVPIFVVTHTVPQQQPRQNARLRFTFVTDGVESAIAQARKAAREKNVVIVGGPTIARQRLSLGLIDELELGIVPVLLGAGLRMFDQLDQQIELEPIRVSEEASITYLRFRVIK